MKNFEYDDVVWYLPITTSMIDIMVWGSIVFALSAVAYMSYIDK